MFVTDWNWHHCDALSLSVHDLLSKYYPNATNYNYSVYILKENKHGIFLDKQRELSRTFSLRKRLWKGRLEFHLLSYIFKMGMARYGANEIVEREKSDALPVLFNFCVPIFFAVYCRRGQLLI